MLTHEKVVEMINYIVINRKEFPSEQTDKLLDVLDEAHDQLIEQRAKLCKVANVVRKYGKDEAK